MRPMVVAVVLLLAGCSNNMGIVSDAIEGGPGQDISVAVAGLESSDLGRGFKGMRDYVMQVEVSNNSNHLVTVTSINIRPTAMGQAFRIEGATASFNEMIDPGTDHIFDIRLHGMLDRDFRPDERRTVAFRVTVSLSNGEMYFYTFEGPVRL